MLSDPPLLRLEGEACHAYLSMLLHLNAAGSGPLRQAADVEQRLLRLCIANLECFEVGAASPHALLTSAPALPWVRLDFRGTERSLGLLQMHVPSALVAAASLSE